MIAMGDFTSVASSVGRTKTAATLNPLSKTAISVIATPPIGAGDRVLMTDRGEAITSADPKLRTFLARLTASGDPGDFATTSGKKFGPMARGFYIAVGTLSGLEYKPAAMRATLDAAQQRGFDEGVSAMNAPAFAVTGSGNPNAAAASSGHSGLVIGGVAIVGLAAVGAIVWKLRKR